MDTSVQVGLEFEELNNTNMTGNPRISQRRGARQKKNECSALRVFGIIACLCFIAVAPMIFLVNDHSSNYDNDLEPIIINSQTPLHQRPASVTDIVPLPKWVDEYITWHQEMRAKFPGKAIIEDPDAPPVLVRTCLGLCGGLHDRLGQLPFDLYLASQSKRVLLIKWIKPQPLEDFLIPPKNGIDWTFPRGIEGWGTDCNTLNLCAKQIRAHPQLANNVGDNNRMIEENDVETLLTNGIYSLTEGDLKDEKAVTYTIMAHLSEDVLEARLRKAGEIDMIHNTVTFGSIFRKFFQPHPNVQAQITAVSSSLGLVPGEYSIAHTRVRHPKAYEMGEKFDGTFIANADKTGLPFVGKFKEMAIATATRAIECADTMEEAKGHPIYFMSDSSDLVSYIGDSTNPSTQDLIQTHNVVTRVQDFPNAHIDKNKGRKSEEYYATFVDLWLGIDAKCVSFGIGKYAVFAYKLSATKCKIRYAKEVWGGQDSHHEKNAQTCEL